MAQESAAAKGRRKTSVPSSPGSRTRVGVGLTTDSVKTLDVFSEVDAAARLAEPETQMGPLTGLVGQVCIRRKLAATLRFGPTFASCDECRTDAVSPSLRDHV